MDADQVDSLLEAADDGVELDGLAVRPDGDGYRLRVGSEEERVGGLDDLRGAVSAHHDYVTNWYFFTHVAPDHPPRQAFLRWLEELADSAGSDGASTIPERYDRLVDGHTRTWGQLAITVTLDRETGRRTYDLRHVEDAEDSTKGVESDPEALEAYEDPLEIRELVTYDDRGRYRPLKTAPNLQTGWVFPDLEAPELLRAVDFAYPATIENWHRKREGDLDVSHWRETIDRQTGIYQLVQTWNRGQGHDHVNRVAEASCVDSQCLKRREWEYDEDTDLDVPGGEGEFPCREPCSLVISAARKWTRLEGEEERTYEVELTESELAQLESIVDAVAEGRTEDVREADFDDPANRWRARYLRAKRFADGEFATPRESGPTDE